MLPSLRQQIAKLGFPAFSELTQNNFAQIIAAHKIIRTKKFIDDNSITIDGRNKSVIISRTKGKKEDESLAASRVGANDSPKVDTRHRNINPSEIAQNLDSFQERIKKYNKVIVYEGGEANINLSASQNCIGGDDSQSISSQISTCVKSNSIQFKTEVTFILACQIDVIEKINPINRFQNQDEDSAERNRIIVR